MKQFNLSEWLANPSRKVVTRDGREVTIEKTDIHIHGMSHMILGKYSDIYEIWHINGRINYTGSDCNLDLFFAEEDKTIDDTEMNSLAYLTELGYTCIPHKEEQNARSEEDECMIECIIAAIKMGDYYTQDELNRMTSWLKSLKPRWKPTEEQLHALFEAHKQMSADYHMPLITLYYDLKSL